MEDDDGYFTGETDPFIMENSEEGMVVCPVEEKEEMDVLPPRDESVESTEVFKEDKLEMLFIEGRVAAAAESVPTVDPIAGLKGKLELYMLYVVFGDAGE